MSEIRVDSITDEAGTGAPEITDHYRKSNILGAVSESGGVPTGAIIERGSNANGEFVKYADGTLICSHETGTETTNTGDGNVFRSGGGFVVTYPSPFVNAPSIAASAYGNSAERVWPGNTRGSGSGTSVIFDCILSPASGRVGGIKWIAIGRWY